jgi:hypothetical protein
VENYGLVGLHFYLLGQVQLLKVLTVLQEKMQDGELPI